MSGSTKRRRRRRKHKVTPRLWWEQTAGFAWSTARCRLGRLTGRSPERHRLALCLIFKNSASYLQEWLEYHRLVGVEHFYLYANESEDEYREVLAPYVNSRIVTLHDWPGFRQQLYAYDHCLRVHGPEARWIGFLDDDEFLYPVQGRSVSGILDGMPDIPALYVSMLRFGTSGIETRPPGPVIENFVRCAAELDGRGKCIVRPERVWTFPRPEEALTRGGARIVDENGRSWDTKFNPAPTAHLLRINHYESKSQEEYLRKIARGSAVTGRIHPTAPKSKRSIRVEAANAVENLDIQRFLPELLDRLNSPATAPMPMRESAENSVEPLSSRH